MTAPVRMIPVPDEEEFQQWKAQQQHQTGDDADFEEWKKKNKPPGVGATAYRTLEAFGRGIGGGGSLGRTLLPIGHEYAKETAMLTGRPEPTDADLQQKLAADKAEIERFKQAHPVLNYGAQGAGMIANPLTRGMGLFKGGAVAGGLQGFGESEGTPLERIGATAMGAAGGLASAGVLKGFAPVARLGYDLAQPVRNAISQSSVGQAVGSTVGPMLKGALARVSPMAERFDNYLQTVSPGLATRVGPTGSPGGVPGATPPPNASRAASGAQSAVSSLLPESVGDRANRLLTQKLVADKGDLTSIMQRVLQTRKPLAIGELGGENVLGLQRAARSVPSEAKQAIPQALYERQAGMQSRLVNDATELAGTGGRTNIPEAIEAFGAARDAQAAPAFDALRQSPPVSGVPFAPLLETPAGRSALKQAATIAGNKQRPFPPIFDENGQMRPLSFDDVQDIKLAFDDLLGTNPTTPLESGGLGKSNARAIRELKNHWTDLADKAFPGYAQARQNFAEPSAVMNALNDGRNFFNGKLSTDELALTMSKMSDPERRAFVQSGMEELATRIESGMASHDRTGKVILPTQMQQRIRLLFPDDPSFAEFINRAEQEAQMRRSLNFTTGGSNTADKLAEQLDLDTGGIPKAFVDVMKGRFGSAASSLGQSALVNRARGVTAETANALAPKFTAGMSGNRQEVMDLIQQLMDYQARATQRMTARAAASRPFSGFAGGVAGNAFSQRP